MHCCLAGTCQQSPVRSGARTPRPRRVAACPFPAFPPAEEEELFQLTRDARTIFVGQLVGKLDERDVRDYFAQVGGVVDVQLIRDRVSGKSKGFGYVRGTRSAEPPSAARGDVCEYAGAAPRPTFPRPRRSLLLLFPPAGRV